MCMVDGDHNRDQVNSIILGFTQYISTINKVVSFIIIIIIGITLHYCYVYFVYYILCYVQIESKTNKSRYTMHITMRAVT